MSTNEQKIIAAYQAGKSIQKVAEEYDTCKSQVHRILKRNGIETRPEMRQKGELFVKDGDKLLEWAKAQGRLVTQAELAQFIGTKRLSPSYFLKYPELGKYVVSRDNKCTKKYTDVLYKWLNDNNIPYKPNDRTRLQVSVDALLLYPYSNIALHVDSRPVNMSRRKYYELTKMKIEKARKSGVCLILLEEEQLENLDELKRSLEALKD